MKEIDFNINDYVHVKMNSYGMKIWNEHWEQLNTYRGKIEGVPKAILKAAKLKKKGWYKFQMWEFMNIFGKAMWMGNGLPFETVIKIQIDK